MPSHNKHSKQETVPPGTVAAAFHLSTWEVKAGRTGVQDQSCLHSTFLASLDYTRPVSRKTKTKATEKKKVSPASVGQRRRSGSALCQLCSKPVPSSADLELTRWFLGKEEVRVSSLVSGPPEFGRLWGGNLDFPGELVWN